MTITNYVMSSESLRVSCLRIATKRYLLCIKVLGAVKVLIQHNSGLVYKLEIWFGGSVHAVM